jgi:phosphatidylglycerol:prolipoprotein diacylglycerol transferase
MEEIKLYLYHFLFAHGTNQLYLYLSFISAFILFFRITRSWKDRGKITICILLTSLSAYFGARILHVLIERPELLRTPQLIFSRFDGMTFNGSLLFGSLCFFLSLFMFDKIQRSQYWDEAARALALSYGFLRLSCFSKGCCWGNITTVPWSVKYFHSIYMPWHGIPVHPVQLYDAALGFSIFFILTSLSKEKRNGFLFPIFLLLYSFGRFFTEYFRGDSIRGEHILGLFSTSQWVSIVLTIGTVLYFLQKRPFALMLGSLLLTACVPLPSSPNDKDFQLIQRLESFEVYENFPSRHRQQNKNLLFLAADDNIQFGFSDLLKAAIGKDQPLPRIEDLTFWNYLPNLKKIYRSVVRIPYEKVNFKNFSTAVTYLESLGEPYDLVVLSHGMPNHLSTGSGYFFSYRELATWKGQLHHLHLVFLQSCYGQSLENDFFAAGAQYVMSYPGMNRNFFFFGLFLYYYPENSVEDAYELTHRNFDFWMSRPPYDQISNLFLAKMNQQLERPLSHEDWIDGFEMPRLIKQNQLP